MYFILVFIMTNNCVANNYIPAVFPTQCNYSNIEWVKTIVKKWRKHKCLYAFTNIFHEWYLRKLRSNNVATSVYTRFQQIVYSWSERWMAINKLSNTIISIRISKMLYYCVEFIVIYVGSLTNLFFSPFKSLN